eukprot:gnl/TRDRNA2_/TRDRNA2_135311_c1_seq2.p1 gnl/TRDRNA2_/TRDRNA2_135311_c1~~gnl/TRDRNA2_/TRDRNA2_135311_c1_seq2.p1  ORF type:complete len:288 (-),score=49.11 gnl/TRDRNA2_/TRDRNA2_135311_c1_seq2:103-966(-)
MPGPSAALTDQLLQEGRSHDARCGGKFLALVAMLIGVSLAVLVGGQSLSIQMPTIALVHPASVQQSVAPTLPASLRAKHFMPPSSNAAARWSGGFNHVVHAGGTTDSNSFKNGMNIELDGQPYKIIEFLHVKPGKGSAFVRTKIKNLLTKNSREMTFKAGEKVDLADMQALDCQYTYDTEDEAMFMNMESYEEMAVEKGDWFKFLKEGCDVTIKMYNGKPMDVELPNTMSYEVTATEIAIKGDSTGSVKKPATIETGAEIRVPAFIEVGQKIKVDTRTGEYLSRDND